MRDLIPVTTLVCALLFGTLTQAEPVDTPEKTTPEKQNGERFKRNLKQWQSMPPEQRRKLRELHERWKNMSEEERERVRMNHRRFMKMKQERRRALLKARRVVARLQPKIREELHRRMHGLRQMPPERRRRRMLKLMTIREILKDDCERLRQLPPHSPEIRQQVFRLRVTARALHRLGPEQIERLKNLPTEKRREAIRRLVEKMRPGPPENGPRRFRPGNSRPERMNRDGNNTPHPRWMQRGQRRGPRPTPPPPEE